MEKLIQYIGLAVKAVIFMTLLAIFCILYLLPVMTQYSEKYSNIAKLSKTTDKVEMPTISICAGWKTSIMDNYKITRKFLYPPTNNKSNLPTDATVRNVYSDITYKLNEDFAIGLIEGSPKEPKSLMVGMNEIFTGKSITKYDVKEVSTTTFGICYAIIPNEIFMKPYADKLILLLAKNNTSNEDKMDEIMVQISSKDTLHTIYATAPGMNNEMISSDFELQNYLDILYTEENTEYIKDCSEVSFFKCYGTRIAESEGFKCRKKCVTLTYQAIMDTIDHNMPRCKTDAEHYCMTGTKSFKTIYKLKSTCPKQCNYKGSKLAIKKSVFTYPYQLGTGQITVRLRTLPEIVYNKEYLIYDDIGMFGSIGGSLGLFLGFSLFDTLCMIVDFILRKVCCQFSQT
jgi:hypothetical protein